MLLGVRELEAAALQPFRELGGTRTAEIGRRGHRRARRPLSVLN